MKRQEPVREDVREALTRIPFPRESHALKAVFAMERLWSSYPAWPDQLRQRAQTLRESLHYGARIDGLIHGHLRLTESPPPRRRWRESLEIGLFPFAYLAAATWCRTDGIENLVLSYRDKAVAGISMLGHSWTVWCSFYEALPYLVNEAMKLSAAERFAEFVSQQFRRDSAPLAKHPIPRCADVLAPAIDLSEVLWEALERPGFLGHHLITLATLLRHRALLDDHEFAVGLLQTRRMIRRQWGVSWLDVTVSESLAKRYAPASESELERRLRACLAHGIDNVHAVTLADSVLTLWWYADDEQRSVLLSCLDVCLQDAS